MRGVGSSWRGETGERHQTSDAGDDRWVRIAHTDERGVQWPAEHVEREGRRTVRLRWRRDEAKQGEVDESWVKHKA